MADTYAMRIFVAQLERAMTVRDVTVSARTYREAYALAVAQCRDGEVCRGVTEVGDS